MSTVPLPFLPPPCQPLFAVSHTSIDKPFVEKLAHDLRSVGVNVWFDKWEIQVGQSITWKIEEGIRENEFLAIVLSPEALKSEWVKTEISAAWVRQMAERRVFVLPILYRECEIPLFLADKKYADFRGNYDLGVSELVDALGVRNRDVLKIDNWRKYARKRIGDWQRFRDEEFESLILFSVDEARKYNWSVWVGGRRNAPYTIVFSARNQNLSSRFAVRLDKQRHAYLAALDGNVLTPNTIRRKDFSSYVGNTLDECQEFLWRRFQDFESSYGKPTELPVYFVSKFLTSGGKRRNCAASN
ncbi:hypothetical protein DAETH_12210 [Deinococcus aetherius]|uniref:TIR domain-containing protein n=2 Tax=Deinococcus aetherius TaxID=200252 RepID=A0ABN6RD23_9DEIO|nr:toll/interleukin-1 receptor domain-containing protein [Deinococcus aetherius]BDP41252.1 hypothetical protein DAETH_12210 [Deinococcus aetherius]